MNFSLKQTITKRRFKLNTLKKYVRWQKVQLQIAINNPIYTRNMFGKFIYIILFPVHLMVLFIYLWYVCILHAPILKTSFSKKKRNVTDVPCQLVNDRHIYAICIDATAKMALNLLISLVLIMYYFGFI